MRLQLIREQEGHFNEWQYLLWKHYKHTRDRLNERYDIDISYAEWEELNESIFYDKVGRFVFESSNYASCYCIQLRGQDVLAYYSETAYCITTVVPADDFRQYGLTPRGRKNKYHTDKPSALRQHRISLAATYEVFWSMQTPQHNETGQQPAGESNEA